MLTHQCCGLWLTSSCKLRTRHQEHEKDNLSSRTIWKTDTVLKEGYVPFQSICNTVCTREAATSPAQRPAVKLPLGLGETVECGWCESWFELEIAKAQGLQLWAAMSGWGCVCPSWWNSRVICGVRLCVFASANVSAYGHVCIFTCCLQASISHSWGCHLRERDDVHTHFLFEVVGRALLPHPRETSGMWDTTILQKETSLKDLASLPVSWEQLSFEQARQVEMTANFCSGDFLSCPGQRVR